MSGVLDRMVQRSRGELPAVEPLVSPQRTAAALRQGLVEESVDREAPASAAPREIAPAEPRTQRVLAAREDHAPLRQDELAAAEENPRPARESAQPVQEPSLTAESAPVDRSFEAPERPRNLMRDREKLEIEADAEKAGVTPEAPRAKPRPESRVEDAQNVSLLGREVAAPQGAKAHEPESASPRMQGTVPPKRNEIELEEKLVSLRPREPAEPHMAEPASRAPHTAAPGNPATAPQIETGEHTEIHITIGSIELRAPRTEAKAPPFRPRVTLDEFLRRSPGAES